MLAGFAASSHSLLSTAKCSVLLQVALNLRTKNGEFVLDKALLHQMWKARGSKTERARRITRPQLSAEKLARLELALLSAVDPFAPLPPLQGSVAVFEDDAYDAFIVSLSVWSTLAANARGLMPLPSCTHTLMVPKASVDSSQPAAADAGK